MALTPGARLGSYDIIAGIGSGGMGEVYRARDTRLNRDVAIKVLPELFAMDADRLARFTREAQTLAALNHPNIAQIYGLEEAGPVHALVMELVEGEDLSTTISRGPMPAGDALPIARQIADALEAAHEQGIVHRDLKPANVKLRPDGTVKVLDFGLAKAMGPAAPMSPDAMHSPTLTARATQLGVVIGTAAYMAPEQAKGKTVDKRADIWAFGVVLYEMLTGRRAFDGDDVTSTLAAVIMRDPDWTALPMDVPPTVRGLLARCLIKDPKQRLRDVGDARLALGGDAVLSGVTSVVGAEPVRPARSIGALAGWAIAAVMATAAGYLLWSRPAAPTSPAPMRLTIPLDTSVPYGSLNIALAPDGHAIVIHAPWTSQDRRLYLRKLDSGAAEPLPGTEGGRAPFWSPDSRSIGFVSEGRLRLLDVEAGTFRVVCEAPQMFAGGAWSADGTILFSGPLGPLNRVPAAGGQPVALALAAGAGEEGQGRPVFLPDGKRFTYLSRRSDRSIHTILGRLDSDQRLPIDGEGVRVVWADDDWLLYRRGEAMYAQRVNYESGALLGEPTLIATDLDSRLWTGIRETVATSGVVAYVENADKRRQFTWYARAGRPEKAIGPAGEYMTFDLSADGRRIIASMRSGDPNNLWTIDAVTGAAGRVTVGDMTDVDPRWSPDGHAVLFGSLRDPVRSPHRVALDGSAPTLAWKFDGRLFALDDWSTDGRWLLYHDANTTTIQARLVDPAIRPGETRNMVIAAVRTLAGNVDQAQMSPDGRWVAYNGDESGRSEVFVVPFPPTGDRVQVSRDGGVQPTWRADTKEIYFLALDGTLMAVSIKGGADLGAGEPTPLFKANVAMPTADIEQYAPNADGTRFLFLDVGGQTKAASVQVLTDWRALVAKAR